MKRLLETLFIAGAAATFVGCSGSAKTDASKGDTQTPGQRLSELPMPEILPGLDTPELRVNYALGVYWDSLDFTDHSLSLDTAFMEQSFSNFAALMQYVPVSSVPMENLVRNASADTLATIFVWEIADKYLNEPNSPMRDAEKYRIFLHALAESPVVTDAYRDKLRYQMAIAELNRPGTVANDFSYVTRDGKRKSLLSSAKGKLTMVIFYDSDCDNCKHILGDLVNITFPDGVKVIAVDVADNKEIWIERSGSLPADWEVGFAIDDLNDERLYHLPALPTVYLLDKDGRVLLKDPTPRTAIATITQNPQ